MALHAFLDHQYGPDGDAVLAAALKEGADPNARAGELSETLLHVAARRRRVRACEILLDHGADIDAQTAGRKTAYAHAIRRSFDDVVAVLLAANASSDLNAADEFAVAVVSHQFAEARSMLEREPGIVRTGNGEEDRLLADVAGREATEPVALLVQAGADLAAPGLDGGSPLHQAGWFGQPNNARILIDAGAPLDVRDAVHGSSPIGWVAHGSQFSGGADEAQNAYVALAQMMLDAGASLRDPSDPSSDAYRTHLLTQASDAVAEVLRSA